MARTYHIKLDLTGLQKHTADFRRQALDVIERALMDEHRRDEAMFRGTPYPPERPGQRYVRTGTLGRSWKHRVIKKTRSRVEVGVENTASQKGRNYASYPLGDDEGRQAWMHRGRWWVALQKYEATVDRKAQRIRHDLAKLWRQTAK